MVFSICLWSQLCSKYTKNLEKHITEEPKNILTLRLK